MDQQTINSLLSLNRAFYSEFAAPFAATRRRIQPGVRRVLGTIPDGQNWLDLGCGSGALAVEWAGRLTSGSYTGLDFSAQLLAEAQSEISRIGVPAGLQIGFYTTDLSDPDWSAALPPESSAGFDGALAFAVLHHIPSYNLRRITLQQTRSLLKAGGMFIHSEWQFQNSPRLMARRVGWEAAALKEESLEEGDTLLDWRHALPGAPAQNGLRYVHLFNRDELTRLAADSGFTIVNEFESDGEGGRLGLYQVWQAR
jgi:SAM-dependent methyltransferase